MHPSSSLRVTFWSYVPLDNYVCVDCGYVESYVGDETWRREIAEKWPRRGGEGGIAEDGETRKLRQ